MREYQNMGEVFRNLIGGQWVESVTGETFERRNPATGETVGTFTNSDHRDVDAAVAAATKAFASWRLYPAPKRGEILFKAARILEERKEEYAREMTEEMGKVLDETRGDVQEAIDMTYYMAGEGRRMFGQTTPSEMRSKFQMSVRKPHGVVGLITPWNFPMAIPSWKMLPAIVAGNTVVLKPATFTPKLSIRLVEVLQEAGIPDGVVNIVLGSGTAVGDPLLHHPDVPVISFTGSTETGKAVAIAAAQHNKRLTLELGGKNAVVVMDDANLDLAVDGILWGAFGTTGQRCTATSRVVVHRAVQAELAERLAERAGKLTLGNGLEAGVQVGPLVSAGQLDTVHSYMEIGRHDGADLIAGGEIVNEGALANGFFHQPTVFNNVAPSMRIAQEEIFGPGRLHYSGRLAGPGNRCGERGRVRSFGGDFHAERHYRIPGDAGHLHGHPVHQCGNDRSGDSPALRWHQGHGQRPPGSGYGRDRLLHGVAERLCRLLRQAPAGANRSGRLIRLAVKRIRSAKFPTSLCHRNGQSGSIIARNGVAELPEKTTGTAERTSVERYKMTPKLVSVPRDETWRW
jgi:aldehyde dehydrogenase (NAD+)